MSGKTPAYEPFFDQSNMVGLPAAFRTDGESFAHMEVERALIELSADGDSPCYPNNWEWCLFFDGNLIDSDCEQKSLTEAGSAAISSMRQAIRELESLASHLSVQVALWEGNEEGEERKC